MCIVTFDLVVIESNIFNKQYWNVFYEMEYNEMSLVRASYYGVEIRKSG